MSGMLFLFFFLSSFRASQRESKEIIEHSPELEREEEPLIEVSYAKKDALLEPQKEEGVALPSPQGQLQAPVPSAFEQEFWNLPGFQSILAPFKRGLSVDEFNLLEWEAMYSNSSILPSSSNHVYSFPSFRSHCQGLSNLEAFVKEMLLSLSEYLPSCSVSACLRSRARKYHLFLQFSGSVFFSEKNTAMEGKSWQEIIERIEKGEYVILNEGKDLAFPLASRFGPLGFLHFRCEEALSEKEGERKEILEKIWYAIRKYGESLLQATIYERSIRDPESSLLSGMRFQEDLAREMACRLERNIPCRLILTLLRGEAKQESISFLSQKLSLLFPFPQRVYRIAQNLFPILDTRGTQETKKALSELKASCSLHENSPFDLSIGSAVPALDLDNPQEWFEEAQKELY